MWKRSKKIYLVHPWLLSPICDYSWDCNMVLKNDCYSLFIYLFFLFFDWGLAFLPKSHLNQSDPEAYSKSLQTSKMEYFAKRLKTINYFRKKLHLRRCKFWEKNPQVHLTIIREWPNHQPPILRNLDNSPSPPPPPPPWCILFDPPTIRHERVDQKL